MERSACISAVIVKKSLALAMVKLRTMEFLRGQWIAGPWREKFSHPFQRFQSKQVEAGLEDA
jgi:hypothetical protein